MMKKTLLALYCICAAAGITTAQEKKTNDFTGPVPNVKLRFSPLALVEPDMSFMFGAEYRLNNKWSVGSDLAYIFYSFRSSNSINTNGYKARAELRYYFKQKNRVAWFTAFELGHKQTYSRRSEEVGIGAGPDFFQRVEYRLVRSAPSASLKFGFQRYIDKNQKLFIEGFLGVGVKVISEHKKDYVLPPGASTTGLEDDIYYTIFSDGVVPNFPAGLRIGFRL